MQIADPEHYCEMCLRLPLIHHDTGHVYTGDWHQTKEGCNEGITATTEAKLEHTEPALHSHKAGSSHI